MRTALYGKIGKIVTLREFIALEGEKKPDQWVTKPYCPRCKRPLHAYGVAQALKFDLVSRELVKPKKVRAVPGFHHLNHDAGKECLLLSAQDSRFAELDKKEPDDRVRKKVKDALFDSSNFQLNHNASHQLWFELTNREMQDKEKRKMASTIQDKKLYDMEGLAAYPWLLPFFLMVGASPQENFSKTKKKKFFLVFKEDGEQKLPFKTLDGKDCYVTVPKKLVLGFPGNQWKKFKPCTLKKRVWFPVSEPVARHLARDNRHRSKQQHLFLH